MRFLNLFLVSSLAVVGCAELGPDADCFERRVDEEFGNPSIQNTCEYEQPCESLDLLCPGSSEELDCGPQGAIVENPEALTCMLDALAAGETGYYSWGMTAADNRGWAGRTAQLWVVGRNAYYASRYAVDLDVEIDGVRFVELRSRSEFEACQGRSDAERLECVMRPFTDVLGEVIPPG